MDDLPKISPQSLDAQLKAHCKWGRTNGAYGAQLQVNKHNLDGCELRGAMLRCAEFQHSSMRGANLVQSDFAHADLTGADLRNADLGCASLHNTCLLKADLRNADLRNTDLRYANLLSAKLHGAELPAPTMVLLANWGYLPTTLTLELMRYDASCHPQPEVFDEWAQGGPCPYEVCAVQRAAHFVEKRQLWLPGPSKSAYELMCMVLDFACDMETE